jgi:hypothetical protein
MHPESTVRPASDTAPKNSASSTISTSMNARALSKDAAVRLVLVTSPGRSLPPLPATK